MMLFSTNCKKTPSMLLTKPAILKAFDPPAKTDTVLRDCLALGVNKAFAPNSPPNYTQFKPEAYRRYNLIFDANGGCDAPADYSYAAPVQAGNCHTFLIPKSIPLRNGYNFKGWSMCPDSVTAQYQSEDSINVNSSTVLYAVWEKSSGIINAYLTIKLIFNGIKLCDIPDDIFLSGTATDNTTRNIVWHGVLTRDTAIYSAYDNSLLWIINAELLEDHAHIWNFTQNCSKVQGYDLSVAGGPIYTGENLITGTRCITNTYIKNTNRSVLHTHDTESEDDFLNHCSSCKRFKINTPFKKSS